ncbi:MAG: peroxiredoxin [Ferroplasma sp.]|uniref:peroxiredoxin n=1 Tax=Ferroplasma sp. TaxID=2591003 RepID=UPI002815C448|nr:peroxiredoxin [Ferroplasma sp.]WMT51739.1 MAG: peroxiredoxin [Ferroplasma sp.]
METLNVGDTAPDFEAVDQDGNKVRLSDFKNDVVVLYFYPKDNTPGCTMEAKNFRDNMDIFKDKGIKVLGVSVDSSESHKKFQDKFNLNFTLVSDKQKDIVKKYGVMGLATAKRVTYLIKDGKIVFVYPKVSPKEHAKEVYDKIMELKLVE